MRMSRRRDGYALGRGRLPAAGAASPTRLRRSDDVSVRGCGRQHLRKCWLKRTRARSISESESREQAGAMCANCRAVGGAAALGRDLPSGERFRVVRSEPEIEDDEIQDLGERGVVEMREVRHLEVVV